MAILIAASVLFVGVLLTLAWRVRHLGSRPKDYPPGPPTLPIIGNLHQIPKEQGHIQFQKWAQEYGPIYSLILGSQVVIILSSDEIVKDLLDKRSAIYSSRPEMYISGQVASGGIRFSLMPYGDLWRMLRRIVHSILNVKAAQSYVPYQELENKQMLCGLLDQPDRFIDHIHRYTSSLTTQMVFGWRAPTIEDERVAQIFDSIERLSIIAGSSSGSLPDFYPWLRSLPDFLLPARQYAKQLHRDEKALYLGHYLDMKRAIKNGTAKPSFCTELVKAQEAEGLSDQIAGYASGVLHEAGSDTSAATLVAFVQAMILFPEVQKKAREEIDQICGPDKMPTMKEEPQLNYIRACQKEALRWMPTVIMGLPHAVTRDDVYKGYTIPKGASVLLNTWAIHMDPKRYANPESFDPSRYENDRQTASEAAGNPDVSKRDHFGFGAGRRICPGMHIAERTLFLSMARMVWAFEFGKSDTGEPPVAHNLTEGLLAHPKPYAASIKVRSIEHEKTIRRAWAECGELLDEEMQWKQTPVGMVINGYTSNARLKGEIEV